MLKLQRLPLLQTLLALLMLTSCHEENDFSTDNQFPDEPQLIGFGAQSGSVKEVRSAASFVDQEAFLQEGHFVVYSNYDYNLVDGNYTETVPDFQKQDVTYDAPTQQWTYQPKKYWNGTGAYHFRAFFPKEARVIPNSNGKNLAIEYSVYKDQCDLMVAYHYRNMDQDHNRGKVNLKFNHALSAIRIKMVAEEGRTYTLKNFYLKNLYTVGVLAYKLPINSDDETQLNDAQGNSKLINDWLLSFWDDSKVAYNYTGTNSDKITADKNNTFQSSYYYALPQTIDGNLENGTQLCFTIDVQGQEVTTIKKLPSITWYPGKKYTYLVSIKPNINTTIEVITTRWDEVDATSKDIIIE